MLIISAAAVGVGALRSATKSEMVKSVWCPIAEIIGSWDEKISLATNSSLNDHKSSIEPPPLQTIKTSTSFLWFAIFKASAIPFGANFPWTGVG